MTIFGYRQRIIRAPKRRLWQRAGWIAVWTVVVLWSFLTAYLVVRAVETITVEDVVGEARTVYDRAADAWAAGDSTETEEIE